MRDEGDVSDASMTRFDGSTGIDVPESVLAADKFPGSVFTVSTWMRHAKRGDDDKHRKEHIVCRADDHREYIAFSATRKLVPGE